MALNFYRRVGFGLSPNETQPSKPLNWALNQLNSVPNFLWPGSTPTEKEIRNKLAEWVYGDRESLRKKYKNDQKAYEKAKDELRIKTGESFFELNEHAIRHYQTKNSSQPVFERFWLFWGNHFAISEKDFLPEFSTGPYQREIIRPNMTKTFQDMVQSVTTSWCMIHHLDNSQSVGPNSKSKQWNPRGTINENHARELLELHTVSPSAGYTQEDVIQLAYIMTGWSHKWSNKKLETGDVWFDQDRHQTGEKQVLGVIYKNDAKRELPKVIHDLATHPVCIKFVSTKLCRHFITDEPTEEMVRPVIDVWNKYDGNLIEIQKEVVRQAYKYKDTTYKFQVPEVWLMQLSKIFDLNIPLLPSRMNYDFKTKPSHSQRRLSWWLREIGHSPYRAKQPNGWSDFEVDWVSPELLLRRLWFSSNILPKMIKAKNYSHDFTLECLKKNFNDYDRMSLLIKNLNSDTKLKEESDMSRKYGIICNLPGVLKA
ncbi:MAG: DUF1800 family protein [Pelagibacteraceae bacterium]|nr:DUF1800 family protein [Pelagibacteraceae bacterium]